MINMKTILLKFSGPLQSWGTTSHFETRYTDPYPSKSAVIGMIAGSLGYRRDEDQNIKKLNDLDFGVRVDQAGRPTKDYQTVKKYKKNGELDRTYVTNRYYLEDAVFVVAISHENEQYINRIEEGLKHPYFQPFMGRRSLPLTVDFLIGIKNTGVIESLKEIEWQAAKWYKKDHSNILEAYVDSDLLPKGSNRMRKDRVQSFSPKNRKFNLRGEKRFEIYIPKNSEIGSDEFEEHDAFDAIGG